MSRVFQSSTSFINLKPELSLAADENQPIKAKENYFMLVRKFIIGTKVYFTLSFFSLRMPSKFG